MYPDAKIWVIGHSLGGALSSLIGTTFGAPTVAFEAPGERMAAQRLHLPMPVSFIHLPGAPLPVRCTSLQLSSELPWLWLNMGTQGIY